MAWFGTSTSTRASGEVGSTATEATVARLWLKVQPAVDGLRSSHPDWSDGRLAAAVAGRFGAQRLIQSAMIGATGAIPFGGRIASAVGIGADESQSIDQVIMMAMAIRMAHVPRSSNASMAEWLDIVLSQSGIALNDGAAFGAMAGRMATRAAGTSVVRRAATTGIVRRLGKAAPFGAAAALAAVVSGRDVARVARTAFRLAGMQTFHP